MTAEFVQRALASEDLGDRLDGINQLRQLPPEVAFELIQPAVNDSHPRIRYGAVSQLANLGRCNPTLAGELLRDRLFNDDEVDVRSAAADAMAALQLTNSLADLQSVYEDTSDWLLQFSIIAALGALGDRAALPLLYEALSSDQELVKLAAIGSLGELGCHESLDRLGDYINYPDWQIRHRLAIALGQIGGDRARSLLEQMIQDRSETVVDAAQNSLKTTAA
ncbi:HEAT repeat domain-containing protein [Candidatus Synechococcus calcipolaris G9]|uniref:HEAT repeat domain-containing protein n=1 Tax=Candidatus Synechococcus calcipolaris G9 TaxID=1497997 RepID=A0ABT6F082_9SYNE|nr:HEAT repeat domain-containing protein [Candidatus Synechococcus calcipolaris]MDG2991231.1 HEAT repeat domain-containing protein [Candidatus Synechococcus calcipolaris G9]